MPATITPTQQAQIDRYRDNALAARTRSEYEKAAAEYTAWCMTYGHGEFDPSSYELFAIYVATERVNQSARNTGEQLSPSALTKFLAAVAWHWVRNGYTVPRVADPGVSLTRRGVQREVASGHHAKQAEALSVEQLRAMIAAASDTAQGKRDVMILLLAYCGALRESELRALQVEDVDVTGARLRLYLRSSKGARDGAGVWQMASSPVWAPDLSPAKAVRRWLAVSGITSGALVRGLLRDQTVREGALTACVFDQVVQRLATAAGIEGHFTMHSLRASWITHAFGAGIDPYGIQQHARHRRYETTLSYRRDRVGAAAAALAEGEPDA